MEYTRICFVIMPFGEKKVGDRTVNFDALYDNIFMPAISAVSLPEGVNLSLSREAIVVSHMKVDGHLPGVAYPIYRYGEIYIRRNIGFVHFVSYDKGEVRLVTTWSLRDEGDKTLEGRC